MRTNQDELEIIVRLRWRLTFELGGGGRLRLAGGSEQDAVLPAERLHDEGHTWAAGGRDAVTRRQGGRGEEERPTPVKRVLVSALRFLIVFSIYCASSSN